MIKYNNSNINDWYFYTSDIIKVYRNNAVCYYKVTTNGGTSGQTPCFAVVDDISSYQEREFEDVFNKSNGKWYKLNNLNQYEQYGVYGNSIASSATTYQGKLSIYDGYEYIYSGSSWQSVGEVSGSTATLPNVPFVLNYNAKDYDATTHRIAKTTGQLSDTDAIAYNNPSNIVDHSSDGYITISNSSMQIRKSGEDISLFNRYNNSTGASMTIVSKAKTTNECSLITNRDWNYNWMYRQYVTKLTLHGNSETGQITCSSSSPNILSVRTYYDDETKVYYNNWTSGTSTSPISFTYGSTDDNTRYAGALFVGYGWSNTLEQWQGDFYWVYMSQNTLTDAQIQQVIDYNEGGGSIYPMYYDEMQNPPNNVSFSSMTEAEEYECPWEGMNATVDGTKYKYKNGSWVEQSYTQYEYIQTQTGNYLYDFNTNFYPTTANTIETKFTMTGNSIDWGRLICWSSCNGDSCDQTQFRFTTVTSSYAIIGRKGNTSGTSYRPIGSGKTITVNLPLSASTYTYNSGSTDVSVNYNVGTFTLPSTTPMHILNLGYAGDSRYAANVKLFYIKVFDGNGNLVKHYVPSDYNGTPCFYEIVNGDYILDTYTGSNHGTLTLGPAV